MGHGSAWDVQNNIENRIQKAMAYEFDYQADWAEDWIPISIHENSMINSVYVDLHAL